MFSIPSLAQFDVLQKSYKVNPFIGTGGHGHTFPGATVPFGMVQLSPDTRLTGWDGCSAYHYTDSIVYGFSHTHLSGTGVSDYGDILILPLQGNINKYEKDKPGSKFNKSNEKADAGYYHTFLEDYNIEVDLTTTDRCGFHQYTFSNQNKATIFLDLKHRDFVKDSGLKIVSKNEIEGYRFSSAWAKDQRVFFVMRFSENFTSNQLEVNGQISELSDINNADSIKAFFNFDLKSSNKILVKVGISGVDIEGARKNLEKELKTWDFAEVVQEAKLKWKTQFDKIQVKGGNKEERSIFYSSLYHLSIVPNIFSDIDGRFRGLDGKIYQNSDYDTYTIFSLWDTYRAAHPLYTLIDPKRTSDFINTFIAHWEQSSLLPVWELGGNETNCMIGIHSIPVISDAVVKNIKGFDLEKAYIAMKTSMEQDKDELNLYRKNSFIPAGKIRESVSKTLEYAFDDWSIAQVAKYLGRKDDYKKYIQRSQFYKNVFDPQTGFMRPRQNGGWRSPFNPKEVDFNYTEANSWQYSFYVPQDVQGLIKLMKNKEYFIDKLDTLFNTSSETAGRHQADITGLIGQYAHGNEPSHHMAYLYSYAGAPWKTQKIVRQIMDEMYHNKPDGLSGNEDCGQMSAWYVFSAMGFYPVCPGSNDYILGSPVFDEIKLKLGNKKQFKIKAINNSKTNIYIQSISLNGQEYNKSFINHFDIIKGGELILYMGNKPNKNFGKKIENISYSSINDFVLVPVPYIENSSQTFYEEKVVKLSHIDNIDIYYKLSNEDLNSNKFLLYTNPIKLKKSSKISFYAKNKTGDKSYIVHAEFTKMEKGRSVIIKHPYSTQYTGGGDIGLIDMIRGSTNFADMTWQGYQGTDFEATVNLGEIKDIKEIGATFLQSVGSWIWLPEYVKFYSSVDGINFEEIKTIKNNKSTTEMETIIKNFQIKTKNLNTQYIKVFAKNINICPKWHPGAGEKAWVFIDEIIIK